MQGFHVISPEALGLPAALHELLYAKLSFALHEEYQPGNNIQARAAAATPPPAAGCPSLPTLARDTVRV
jgi:hypothetical protein